jgi:hypothetical protein
MDKLNILRQHSSVLVKASLTLRQISWCLRERQYEAAMELKEYYKNELEPLLKELELVK